MRVPGQWETKDSSVNHLADTDAIRIGILGAARINATALLRPADRTHGVAVTTIAARDPDRGLRYARKHGIPRVLGSYDEVVADTDVDAIYVPTPAALHGSWALKALASGKHVLVEKPFTANADEARQVRAAARNSGLIVMEAHHTSFHPFTSRLRSIVASGLLGELRGASGWFHVPIPPGRDIRWDVQLGGGAMMDVGCYPVRMIQDVIGEPTVISARAQERSSVDRRMTAQLDVAGVVVSVDCGIWSAGGLGGGFAIEGSKGSLKVRSPYHPQFGGRVRIDGPGLRVRETADRKSSYRFQLEAFRDAILKGEPDNLDEAVTTMQTIDAAYRAAGMGPRQPLGT